MHPGKINKGQLNRECIAVFIYLASPYTGNEEVNFLLTEKFTAIQMKCGLHIFSPIVHCHEIAKKFNLDAAFWRAYNYGMLDVAVALWVLCLPGWEKSVGVKGEIKRARERKIPVVYVSMENRT